METSLLLIYNGFYAVSFIFMGISVSLMSVLLGIFDVLYPWPCIKITYPRPWPLFDLNKKLVLQELVFKMNNLHGW